MSSRFRRATVVAILVAAFHLGVAPAADQTPSRATRTFTLHHVELATAVKAVEPLLSTQGSLTADSANRRLVVRDRPEILDQVADEIARVDTAPASFRIRFELLEASNTPFGGSVEVRQDAKLSVMLRYAYFRVIGNARFEGRIGDAPSAELAKGYRVRFITEVARVPIARMRTRTQATHVGPTKPSSVDPSKSASPTATRTRDDEVDRSAEPSQWVLLSPLTLERLEAGVETELLRTRLLLAPGQQTVLAVSRSEDSDRALVLVVRAERPEAG